MNDWLIAVLIGIVLGLVLGVRIARESNAKQPVHGGMLAQVFHYLACAGLSGMLPFIIAGIVVGLPFVQLFGTAVGFLTLTALFLLVHAGTERAALPVPH
jgi:ABC-type Fe3+ transport system permease subunit